MSIVKEYIGKIITAFKKYFMLPEDRPVEKFRYYISFTNALSWDNADAIEEHAIIEAEEWHDAYENWKTILFHMGHATGGYMRLTALFKLNNDDTDDEAVLKKFYDYNFDEQWVYPDRRQAN